MREEDGTDEHEEERDRLERSIGPRGTQAVAVERDAEADADERIDQNQG